MANIDGTIPVRGVQQKTTVNQLGELRKGEKSILKDQLIGAGEDDARARPPLSSPDTDIGGRFFIACVVLLVIPTAVATPNERFSGAARSEESPPRGG